MPLPSVHSRAGSISISVIARVFLSFAFCVENIGKNLAIGLKANPNMLVFVNSSVKVLSCPAHRSSFYSLIYMNIFH